MSALYLLRSSLPARPAGKQPLVAPGAAVLVELAKL
jgi:hypothetical protein